MGRKKGRGKSKREIEAIERLQDEKIRREVVLVPSVLLRGKKYIVGTKLG